MSVRDKSAIRIINILKRVRGETESYKPSAGCVAPPLFMFLKMVCSAASCSGVASKLDGLLLA